MERLTDVNWRNLDPWECCGQDHYCQRGCHDEGGCTKGCIVPKVYTRLAAYEDTGLEPDGSMELDQTSKPHKAYKIEGFYCPICAKRHDRIIEIDGVYFTHAEAEAALERRKEGAK